MMTTMLVFAALAGCGGGTPRAEHPVRLPVDVFADTARSVRLSTTPHPEAHRRPLEPAPPTATVWLARVSPAAPVASEVPPPTPESLAVTWPEPPMLAVDEDLKPPIPRVNARLHVPAGARPGWVELDVRVDDTGAVTDAEWAGGSPDTALVRAATDCAFGMRFFPAVQGGREVAVWCRQRFDFGRP
jgi:TonB family protein